ncbi:hypothetical protein F6Q97_06870 [Staphylococcus aureus]|nr:hypothetical protein [Staphylococcus aureus]
MTVVLDFLYYSISNQQLVSNKTILNQKHNQYHNPAGVDYGAPTWRISKRNSTDNASWGGAPTQRNWIPNFYKQCQLGWPPT